MHLAGSRVTEAACANMDVVETRHAVHLPNPAEDIGEEWKVDILKSWSTRYNVLKVEINEGKLCL